MKITQPNSLNNENEFTHSSTLSTDTNSQDNKTTFIDRLEISTEDQILQLQKAKSKAWNLAKSTFDAAITPVSTGSVPDYAEILRKLDIAQQQFQQAYMLDQMLINLGKPSPAFHTRQYPDYLSNIRTMQHIHRIHLNHKNTERDKQFNAKDELNSIAFQAPMSYITTTQFLNQYKPGGKAGNREGKSDIRKTTPVCSA